jgi:hypothetical protein
MQMQTGTTNLALVQPLVPKRLQVLTTSPLPGLPAGKLLIVMAERLAAQVLQAVARIRGKLLMPRKKQFLFRESLTF